MARQVRKEQRELPVTSEIVGTIRRCEANPEKCMKFTIIISGYHIYRFLRGNLLLIHFHIKTVQTAKLLSLLIFISSSKTVY